MDLKKREQTSMGVTGRSSSGASSTSIGKKITNNAGESSALSHLGVVCLHNELQLEFQNFYNC